MTFEEFSKIGMALKTYYPREEKTLLKDEHSIKLWYEALKDIHYNTMYIALQKWVETERWSPTIADLRKMCFEAQNPEIKTWDEAWEDVMHAIRFFGYNRRIEALETFDDITRKVVQRIGWVQLCTSEEIGIERAAFRDIYKALSEKTITEGQIAPAIKKVLDATRESHNRTRIAARKAGAPPETPKLEEPRSDGEISNRVQELLKKTREGLKG